MKNIPIIIFVLLVVNIEGQSECAAITFPELIPIR